MFCNQCGEENRNDRKFCSNCGAKLRDYTKNIKINTHFNEEGIEINELMKEIILNNCNPIERKKLEF